MRTFALVLVGMVTLQRICELVLSRRNQGRLRERGVAAAPDPAFPLMVVAHLILLVGCAGEPWLFERELLPAVNGPAAVLFLLAQGLRIWVLASLGEHWNVRIFASSGDGAVVRGPYRWIRHPNYVAVLVEVFTLPLACSAWFTWVLVQLLHTPVIVRRIRDEERVLFADPGYRAAMEQKPRFVPWGPGVR